VIGAEDERAIVATLLRYATGIDQRDWPLFRTCFTEDAVADYPGFGQWVGARAITDFMEQAHAPMGATLHRVSNCVVAGEADVATARSYVDAVLTLPDGTVHNATGVYQDRLVRSADGWRIAERRFQAVLMRNLTP
jgi:ketosteroid isomerase-like protein